MHPRFRLFGPDTPLTPIAREILSESISALEQRLADGWDLNMPVPMTDRTSELPITLALVENKLAVLDFLLAHDAELNDEGSPAIVTAARNCTAEVLRRLVEQGALVDAENAVGSNAYSAALYSARMDLLPVLHSLGLRVDADGGKSLRQAAGAHLLDAVKFFVVHGIDVNAQVPDMVFPNNPTAVAVAAEAGDLEMVRYLVEHGADVTRADERGARAYSFAIAGGHIAVQEYLRSVEPAHLHDSAARRREFEVLEVPAGLIDLLERKDRRIELSRGPIRFLQFHGLLEVKRFQWEGRTFLDLLEKVDGYCAIGFLAWSLQDRLLVNFDDEHGELRMLFRWEVFQEDPSLLWGELTTTPPLETGDDA